MQNRTGIGRTAAENPEGNGSSSAQTAVNVAFTDSPTGSWSLSVNFELTAGTGYMYRVPTEPYIPGARGARTHIYTPIMYGRCLASDHRAVVRILARYLCARAAVWLVSSSCSRQLQRARVGVWCCRRCWPAWCGAMDTRYTCTNPHHSHCVTLLLLPTMALRAFLEVPFVGTARRTVSHHSVLELCSLN